MEVSLTPDLEQIVNEKVRSGPLTSPNEVVREALLLLRRHDELARQRLSQLREDIDAGVAQADRGELLDCDEVHHLLRQRLAGRLGQP